MNHKCIKPSCENSYQSSEPEAYYCPSCVEANKALAKQIDSQIAARPKKPTKSAWQEYEENATTKGANGLSGMVVKI